MPCADGGDDDARARQQYMMRALKIMAMPPRAAPLRDAASGAYMLKMKRYDITLVACFARQHYCRRRLLEHICFSRFSSPPAAPCLRRRRRRHAARAPAPCARA